MARANKPSDSAAKAKRLAEVIVNERKAQGVTAYRLSEESGLSRSYLSHLENGKYGSLGVDKFAQIVDVLGVSADDLLRQAGYLSTTETELLKAESYLARRYGLSPESIRRAIAFLAILTEEERATAPTPKRRKKK
jgi:transcriptional regulator with XRE-family HTH domain